LADRLKSILLAMSEDDEGRSILQKTGETTKFDMLPEGRKGCGEGFWNLLLPREKIEISSAQDF